MEKENEDKQTLLMIEKYILFKDFFYREGNHKQVILVRTHQNSISHLRDFLNRQRVKYGENYLSIKACNLEPGHHLMNLINKEIEGLVIIDSEIVLCLGYVLYFILE